MCSPLPLNTSPVAERMLTEFEAQWDKQYLPIGQSWRRNWARITPFFDYPPEIRKSWHQALNWMMGMRRARRPHLRRRHYP
jgi:transposase-like protein